MKIQSKFVLLTAIACSTPALAVDYVWNGGTGNWSVGSLWTPNGTPNAATDNATIGGATASIVTLNGNVSVGNLTLQSLSGGNHELRITNNNELTLFGTLTNHGLVSTSSVGNGTGIVIGSAGGVFAGTGTYRLTRDGTTYVTGVAGATLTNQSTHTISGRGVVGGNVLNLTNQGLIEADIAGGTIAIDPNATFANSGTLRAIGGGFMTLGSGTYINTGIIEASGAGSITTLLTGVDIVGGTLRTLSGGGIRVDGNASASGITIAGQVTLLNNTQLAIRNTITNNGTITLTSVGNNTDLFVDVAGATLAGTGNITLARNSVARISGVSGAVLTNQSSHTVQGYGNVGANLIGVVNNGLVISNGGSDTVLTLDPGTPGFDNNGTLRAISGSQLHLAGGTFDNTGTGIIEADGSSARVLMLDGSTIVGGTVRSLNGGSFDVDNSSNVYLDGVTFSGNAIVNNNSDLGISNTLTNNGLITFLNVGNATDFELQNNVTLNGTGEIRLAGSGSAGFNAATAGSVLTHGSGHAISGYGDVGQNTIGLINNGTISANVASQTLRVDALDSINFDAAGTDVVNNGQMIASNGGTLHLISGDYDNASGAMTATGTGSSILLNEGARITGGTLTGTLGGRIITSASNNVGLKDLTLAGTYEIRNNSDTELRGTITNNATVTMLNVGNQTDIELNSDVTLTGSGSVVMAGSGSAGFNGIGGNWVLTHAATHSITGYGNLGRNTIGIHNQGTIIADVNGNAITIDPLDAANLNAAGDDLLNTGTIRATNGGDISLLSAGYANAGAQIIADGAGSVITLHEGAYVTGGTLSGVNGGSIQTAGGTNVGLQNLTLVGDYIANNNSDTEVRGTITNQGTFTVTNVGNQTDIELRSNITLTGLGRVNLAGSGSGGFNSSDGDWQLTNAAGHTIAGYGNIGRSTIRIINDGVIQADVDAQTLTIDPVATPLATTDYGFVNNNTLAAINGGKLVLTGGDFYNNGLVRVDPGASLNISSSANFIHGPGSTLIQSGDVVIESGGTFTNAGIFSPANVGTNGQVTMTGAFVNAAAGRLIIDIAGTTPVTQHDQIVGSGTTQLAGTLEINLLGGFEPTLYGTPIVFIRDTSGSGITGRFDQILNFDLGPTKKLAVIYSPIGAATASQVSIVAAVPGDANVDGSVNFDDLLALAQNYNSTSTMSWQTGDFNADAETDFDDLLSLAQNYGFGAPGVSLGNVTPGFAADWAMARSLVPEPALAFASLAFAPCLRRRR